MRTFLGIDWGGTFVKAGLVDDKGAVIKKDVFISKDFKEKKVFIDQLVSIAAKYSASNIQAVGIGAPGIVNAHKGFIYYLPNVSGWEKFPLKQVLQRKLGLPVHVNNDANMFALAESLLGAAKGSERAICLTLGTGLGGAIFYKGRLLDTGTSAHELGHVPLTLDGIACGCGSRGCIETFVGNQYLVKRYMRLAKLKNKIEVKDIYQRALSGEKAALALWGEFSKNLGKFLAGMINIFNPQVIVFGGGVAGAFGLFKPLITKEIKEHAMWPNVLKLKLVRARVKDPGIVGAALFAQSQI